MSTEENLQEENRGLAAGDASSESLDVLGLLRRRALVILIVVVVLFALAAFSTFTQAKRYEAFTKLVVITKGSSTSLDGGGSDTILDTLSSLKEGRNVETQAEVIDNPDLLQAAMFKLSPAERLKAFHRLADPTQPPEWSYDIKPKQETDVILITTHSYDPNLAAKFANAIAREYLAEDLSHNSQATRQAREYVQAQLLKSQKMLADASLKLSEYAKKTGLVSQEDQISAIAQSQEELQVEQAAAASEDVAAKQRLAFLTKALNQTSGSIPFATTVSENPEFGLVQQQIVQLEGQISEQSEEFQPNSQTMLALKSQLSKLQAQLKGITHNTLATQTSQVNPVRLKLLDDYSDAYAGQITAQAHSDALKSELGRIQAKISALPDEERQLAFLQGRVEVLNRTFNLLSDRYYSLLIEENSSLPSGIIAGVARAPLLPSSPRVALNLISAFFLSVVAGFAAAALLERIDTKIHLPEDAENVSGLKAIGFIPESTSKGSDVVIGKAEPVQPFSESFRILRGNLDFVRPDHKPKTIAVTSASPADGKSTVALNLAIACSMNGLRVILVDTDLRRPNVHRILGLSSAVGLTSLVTDSSAIEDVIKSTPFPNLSAITSGPLPPDPAEFLGSAAAKAVFAQLARDYDLVVLDVPPTTGLSDVQVVGGIADSVLFVVSLDTTRKPVLRAAMRMLRLSNSPLVGLVINRMKKHGSGYYYGYYGYYHSYESYEKKD